MVLGATARKLLLLPIKAFVHVHVQYVYLNVCIRTPE